MLKIPEDIIQKSLVFEQQVNLIKSRFYSSRYLNKSSHSISKWGEWLFAKKLDLEEEIDWSVQVAGDKSDFTVNGYTIDVKTTTYFRYPELKCFPDEIKADIYVLAAVSPRAQIGGVVGFVSREKLTDPVNLKDYRGMGLRYIQTKSQLKKDWTLLKDYLYG